MNIKKKQTKSSALAFSKWLSDYDPDKVEIPSTRHEKKSKNAITEGTLQSMIIDDLELRMTLGELFYQRVNVMGVYDQYKGIYRSLPKGTHKGYPDVAILKQGRAIFLELKSNIGKQSEHQKECQKHIEKQGGEYYLVRSFDYYKSVTS